MSFVTGIEHVALMSFDTKALKNWYISMFDFTQVYDNGKGTYFLKTQDGSTLEFVEADERQLDYDEKTSGIRHVAFTVAMEDSKKCLKNYVMQRLKKLATQKCLKV